MKRRETLTLNEIIQENNIKVLVLSAAYPTVNGSRAMYFVHSRNLYYMRAGIEVTVLNFSSKKGYEIDGIKVISLCEYNSREKYDILIMHAPNVRNHYMFLKKYERYFPKKMFVFHGHEVLHINKYYPKQYKYMKKRGVFSDFFQDVYDSYKLRLWHNYFLKNIEGIRLVFVSNWIYEQFRKEVCLLESQLHNHAVVISNSIGEFFEQNKYRLTDYQFDFLTIRSNLDDSKYGVDIVVKLAEQNPRYRFCLIGKGDFFNYHSKPNNLTWINREMTHKDIMGYINQSKYALLPTREDTQGLMACELASCGLPLITSNIDVCKEVFSDCPNVALIDNNEPNLDEAKEKLDNLKNKEKVWERYFAKNTIDREIKFIFKYNSEES